MKKIVISCLLAFALLLCVLPVASAAGYAEKYNDIAGTWYETTADKYAYPDIFSDDTGRFNGDMDITRIEFVRLLHEALGISIAYFVPNDIRDSFDDMSNDDVGANELMDLVTTGIIKAGGSFSPASPLSREVMIHWLVAALDYKTGGEYVIIGVLPDPFDDDSSITPAYKDDVVKSVILELIKGRGDNMLYPLDASTRAEAVTVSGRLVNLIDTLSENVTVSASAAVTGDKLLMTLTIRNNSSDDVTIHYTSGQRFDFKIFDADGASLYTWSATKSFIQVVEDLVIKPGEIVTYSDMLEGEAFDAIRADAALLKAFITGTSSDFVISTEGYEAAI